MGLAAPIIRNCKILEGTPLKLMSRIVDATGAAILKAAMSATSYKVFTLTTGVGQPVVKVGATSLAPAGIWFDTYQLDGGWSEDSIGYNVASILPASTFSGPDRRGQKYQVEWRGAPNSGEAFWIGIWVVEVVDTLTITS